MEKLFALFAKLSTPRIPVPLDKQAHFVTGALTAFVWCFIVGYWAILIVALIALAKEVYDAHNIGHTCEFYDWLATTLGGCLGMILYYIVKAVQ